MTLTIGYDPVFANSTWAKIIEACQSNAVPDTWTVGDSKTMTINGTDYQIDIIGKSHDDYADGSGKAPLTFQMHDCYSTTYAMNSDNTNSGGWKDSKMRMTRLTALLALMPTEVQNGIREVNKKAGVGGSTTIETVSDKLFLLSQVEILASSTWSAPGEGTQYDYYKEGNSKIKNLNNSAYDWWTRSAGSTDSVYFRKISSSGESGAGWAGSGIGEASAETSHFFVLAHRY